MTAATDPFDHRMLSLLWAGAERAEDMARIHGLLFDPPWDALSLRQLLDNPGSTAFVATVSDPSAVAGFIVGQIAADEAEILSLGVTPAWHRRGVGRALVTGLMRAVARAEARRIFLEVAEDNEPALGLYRGLGFEIAGRRTGYYHRANGAKVDAVMMARALEP